jgi:hypothetical protein
LHAVEEENKTKVGPPPCLVDICASLECVGGGGGACFLEIEELVAEIGAENIQVRRVGCQVGVNSN